VKELSVRVRDPTLSAKILKPPRKAKQDAMVEENDDNDNEDEENESQDEDEDEDFAYQELMAADDQLQEELRDGNPSTPVNEFRPIDDILGAQSDVDDLPTSGQVFNAIWSSTQKLVIPDSEWSNVEIVG
jgi:hypothetical protein